MRRSTLKPVTILGMAALLLISGCGIFTIQVEPISTSSTPAPVLPSSTAALIVPSPTFSTTQRAIVTETPSPVPSKSNLIPNTPLQIIQTHMLDAQSGWGIGQTEGTSVQMVLFSRDGGRTWQDRSPLEAFENLTPDGLRAVAYFASAQSAWVTFAPPQQAAGSSPLSVWHTQDGGKSWQKSQPLDLTNINMEFQYPTDLGFSDDQHGWLLVHLGVGMSHDYIALFTTQDGGVTWLRRLDPDSEFPVQSCSKSGLVFTSPENGYLSGDCPGLMQNLFFFFTSDSGQNWSELSLPVPQGKPADYYAQQDIRCGLPQIQPYPGNALAVTLACANYSNDTHLSWLYITQDGRKWTQHVLPVPNTQISFIDTQQAILLGATRLDPDTGGLISATLDGGVTWVQRSTTGWTGTPNFVDSQNGWVVATHNQVSAFVHTSNGGITWEEIKPLSGN